MRRKLLALFSLFAVALIGAGVAEVAEAPSALASSCSSSPWGNLNPTLNVNHQYSQGPYVHGVSWIENGALVFHRWRLFTMYPGTSWTLVRDVTQTLQDGVWYGIFFTPSYRPGDGRYWQIYLWDPANGSSYRCGSNVVYN